MLVLVNNVSKDYRLGDQTVVALNRVSLNIEQGVFMAIAGPSGSGKSTLLNLIGCIDVPTSGTISVAGKDVSGKSPDELAQLRARTIGFIFQTFNLLPVLSAEENVEYPLLQFKELSAARRQRRVQHYLKVVGLSEFARHRPNQLSGGQRQRVAIARALAVHPKIILADEPTANLDHKTGARILRLMRRINRRTGATFVFSTHDQRVIDMADRRVDLEDGEIVRLGMRNGKTWAYAMERPHEVDPDEEDDETEGETQLAEPFGSSSAAFL
ncbi:MAG: ABC transporter ATP-binding protein [Betaproteobacteria bacterium]|nr:ABC transporter ATP-binding protein [Betaproteobacteria bacterium]